MARIGILTCSSVTQEIPCGCFGCLMAFNGRQGEFKRYAEDNYGRTCLQSRINR
jgi:predicted metal-binding protein